MIDAHGNEFLRMTGRSRVVTPDQRMAMIARPHERRGCCGPGSVMDDYNPLTDEASFIRIEELDRDRMADTHRHGLYVWHYHPGGSEPHPASIGHYLEYPGMVLRDIHLTPDP